MCESKCVFVLCVCVCVCGESILFTFAHSLTKSTTGSMNSSSSGVIMRDASSSTACISNSSDTKYLNKTKKERERGSQEKMDKQSRDGNIQHVSLRYVEPKKDGN